MGGHHPRFSTTLGCALALIVTLMYQRRYLHETLHCLLIMHSIPLEMRDLFELVVHKRSVQRGYWVGELMIYSITYRVAKIKWLSKVIFYFF